MQHKHRCHQCKAGWKLWFVWRVKLRSCPQTDSDRANFTVIGDFPFPLQKPRVSNVKFLWINAHFQQTCIESLDLQGTKKFKRQKRLFVESLVSMVVCEFASFKGMSYRSVVHHDVTFRLNYYFKYAFVNCSTHQSTTEQFIKNCFKIIRISILLHLVLLTNKCYSLESTLDNIKWIFQNDSDFR